MAADLRGIWLRVRCDAGFEIPVGDGGIAEAPFLSRSEIERRVLALGVPMNRSVIQASRHRHRLPEELRPRALALRSFPHRRRELGR